MRIRSSIYITIHCCAFGLFEQMNGDSVLIFVTHHIIMDGWSLEILIKEVISHYKTMISNQKYQSHTLDFQF